MRINISIFILSLLINAIVQAQTVRGLSENPAIKKSLNTLSSLKSASPVKLESWDFDPDLIFFDDFSYYNETSLPDPNRWTDKCVYINHSYPDSAISIGVATFDAVDAYGNIYAINEQITPSDTLTSDIIDLLPEEENELWFSFYYQIGGKGDPPEETDKLFVEYYSGLSGNWFIVDTIIRDDLHETNLFYQVILPIPDSVKNESFRFRFRNLTSMSEDDARGGEGALSNVDFWHIDYVRIKRGDRAGIESLNDIAITKPLKPSLTKYNLVPWTHFPSAYSVEQREYNTLIFRIDLPEIDKITVYRKHYSYDLQNGGPHLSHKDGKNEETSPGISIWLDNFTSSYPTDVENRSYGHFSKLSYIEATDVPQYTGNDTVLLEEKYTDYYAYDDGTAEYGFGISGQGTINAKFAYRFRLYRRKPDYDTLTAIDIFYNKAQFDYTKNLSFDLCVWKTFKGKPGELIYVSETMSPEYEENSWEFKRIYLENELLVADTIYIGWRQHTSEFLNIGYDISSDTRDEMFVSISDSTWFQPNGILGGSVMIHPVFGHLTITDVKTKNVSNTEILRIIPNPAADYIRIEISEISYQNQIIDIYNTLGQLVMKGIISSKFQKFDISDLKPGLYIIRLNDTDQNCIYTGKFIKSM